MSSIIMSLSYSLPNIDIARFLLFAQPMVINDRHILTSKLSKFGLNNHVKLVLNELLQLDAMFFGGEYLFQELFPLSCD